MLAEIAIQRGTPLSRYRATKLMKELNLVSCQPRKHTYRKVNQEYIEVPNFFNRQFAVTFPNQGWCGDVTYLWAGKRWADLAVVIDLFARKLVGWAISFSPDSTFTTRALMIAYEAWVSQRE